MNVSDCLQQVKNVPGDLAEFGVYEGNYTFQMAAQAPNRIVWAWDTFEGMPDDRWLADLDKSDPPGKWKPREDPIRRMEKTLNIRVVKGKFSETIPKFTEDVRFALVHVDCDNYWAHVWVLEFLQPRMSPGGLIVFDDYANCAGAKKAIDEWSRKTGLKYENNMIHIPDPYITSDATTERLKEEMQNEPTEAVWNEPDRTWRMQKVRRGWHIQMPKGQR